VEKSKVEGEVRYFIWLIFKSRNWTADRLERGWAHDAACWLCDQELETAAHLMLRCPCAKEVQSSFIPSNPEIATAALQATSILGWWRRIYDRAERPKRWKTLRWLVMCCGNCGRNVIEGSLKVKRPMRLVWKNNPETILVCSSR
jgi:hypothetical protein